MQSIGEKLEEARKRKGITIREAAEATKIRGEYLNNFENNNFSINVPEIYVRGFLRSYSNYLRLNGDKVITDFNANLIGEAKAAKREHREFFGRMELQHSPLVSADPPAQANPASDAKPSPAEPEEEPEGLFEKIDKGAAIKVGAIAVAAMLLLIVVIWLFRALTSGGIEQSGAAAQATGLVPSEDGAVLLAPAPSETIYLIATGDVRVTVTERSTGDLLLDYFPMVAGQREPVQKSGPIKIDYTEGENLRVEIDSQLHTTGKSGPGFSTVP